MIIFNDNENSLIDILEHIDSFNVFMNGEDVIVGRGSKRFSKIYEDLNDLFIGARLMPAFSVSLHSEALNALDNDVWIRINFKEEMIKNGLKFSALLFKLEEVAGFNLIRLHEGKYEGRCLYLDLDKKTDLLKLIK